MRRFTWLALAAITVLLAAPTAYADRAVISADAPDPWTGGATVKSPLEVVLSGTASALAGRSLDTRCENEADWSTLTGGHPDQFAGFVPYDLWDGTRWVSGDRIELSPTTCLWLQRFASAADKDTKCTHYDLVEKKVTKVVKKRVRVRVRVNGKLRWRWRWVTKRVTSVEEVFQETRGVCAPTDSVSPPYLFESYALWTLAHEAEHTRNVFDEAFANCYGLQNLHYVAESLGDETPGDGHAMALWLYTVVYPQQAKDYPEYWSPECKNGGVLDLNPSSNVWP